MGQIAAVQSAVAIVLSLAHRLMPTISIHDFVVERRRHQSMDGQ